MNRLILIAGLALPCAALAQNAPPPGNQDAPQQQPAAHQPASIEVTSRGEEPHKELRYRPTIGLAERVQLAMNISLTTTMDGAEGPPMELPTITSTWRQTPREFDDDGAIKYDINYESIEVDQSDPIAAQLEHLFAPLTSLTGIGEITDRGEQIRLDLDVPAGADEMAISQLESMKTQMRNLAVIFPQEAVGEGAAWVVTAPVEIDGVQVEQKTTYTLESSNGSSVRLAMAIDQTAQRQKLSPPGLPPEAATVENFSGAGRGEIELNTDRIAPAESNSSGTVTIDLSVDFGPEQRDISQRMESRVKASSSTAEDDDEAGDDDDSGDDNNDNNNGENDGD